MAAENCTTVCAVLEIAKGQGWRVRLMDGFLPVEGIIPRGVAKPVAGDPFVSREDQPEVQARQIVHVVAQLPAPVLDLMALASSGAR